jgi:hypothetical protein
MRVIDLSCWIVLLPSSAAVFLSAHRALAGDSSDVGQVRFPVSATALAQEKFNRAVAMLHSFWYEELDDAFSQVSNDDPRCGMAYWGLAMSYYHPLWSPPDATALRKGWEAVQKAREIGTGSQREKEYIAAIEVFYLDWDKVDHQTRSLAYSKAMEQLHQRYPDDKEAAVFYALALIATAPPNDKTYSNQKKAAEILERVRIEMPDHPGVIHYILHAYDSPPLAHLALAAARRYARVAPAVPHAQHMPSHIFTRLGLWEESIHSNEASATAAREYAQKIRMKSVWDEQIHAMDYLIYAALQCAQDKKAKSVLDEFNAIQKVSSENPKAAYPLAAIPARYALERRNWAEAARLAPAAWLPLERFPWAEAMICFARGVGAARSGQLAAARNELAKIQAFHHALVQNKQQDWAVPTDLLHRELAAWFALAEGKPADAARLMAGAAELEDSTEKLPLTPGPIIPAREQLGDLLLEAKDPLAALREFETSLRSAPNRFNSLYGAANAARATGNMDKARSHFAKLVGVCLRADTERAELQEARVFLKSK